ncbi:hypothetical protein PGIGA_G00053640 [Pangasianodon gigas]|uniref:Uncharacterized protein n=1 Tax=Pangasianodon gigas TaxID=30993 RepID=A0ACC5X2W7_PANGG|nr:hypothetical protein [Pangasianodon gigas]
MMATLWGLMVTVLLMCEVQSFYKQTESNDTIICTAKNMFTQISKDFTQPVPTYIYVQDEHGQYRNARKIAGRCSYGITETPDFIIICVSHSSCHVQKTVHGGKVTFWVNIVVVKLPRSKQGSIFRDPFFKLTVSCTYALLNTSSSTSVEIRAPILTTASVLKKEGMLRAQMRFATDSSFRSFYKIQAPPVMHTLGEPVFVEVFVLKHEDKDLELVLNECWATPSPDPQDELRWNLLHRGCPRQDDNYNVEVLEVQPGDGVKYPKLHKWLKITMFSFTESEDIYESVYLHCDAEVCKGAWCPRTCNRKRRHSGVQRFLNGRVVIQGGPLISAM